jgi:hypothetical protein
MTDENETTWSYTYQTETSLNTAGFNLEELEAVIKEFRQKFDDDISRALFAAPPNPLLNMKLPKIEYEREERPYALNWRYGFGMPVYESQFLPRGEGAIVAGHGVVIGTGAAVIDKLGTDLGTVYYELPKWAMFAILAASLLLLVLVLA